MSIESDLKALTKAIQDLTDVAEGLAAKMSHIGQAVETVEAPKTEAADIPKKAIDPPPAPKEETVKEPSAPPAPPATETSAPAAPASTAPLTPEQLNDILVAEVSRLGDGGAAKVIGYLEENFGTRNVREIEPEKYQALADAVKGIA